MSAAALLIIGAGALWTGAFLRWPKMTVAATAVCAVCAAVCFRRLIKRTGGSMPVHADIHGVLDRCHCGADAGFEESHSEYMEVRARCTECHEQTYWFPTADGAMCAWNMEMRERGGKKGAET